jgi:hypothetical protein
MARWAGGTPKMGGASARPGRASQGRRAPRHHLPHLLRAAATRITAAPGSSWAGAPSAPSTVARCHRTTARQQHEGERMLSHPPSDVSCPGCWGDDWAKRECAACGKPAALMSPCEGWRTINVLDQPVSHSVVRWLLSRPTSRAGTRRSRVASHRAQSRRTASARGAARSTASRACDTARPRRERRRARQNTPSDSMPPGAQKAVNAVNVSLSAVWIDP